MENQYFSAPFVEQLMQQHQPEQQIRVIQVMPLDVDNSASILAVLTAGRSERTIGHFGLAVTYEANGEVLQRNMVMKIKPHGNEISEMLNALATICGGQLPAVYEQYKHLTGFQHTHMREIEVYAKLSNSLTPDIFGLYADDEKEVYIILMEYLQEVELLNSVMHPEFWTDAHIKAALAQVAASHATYLQQDLPLDKQYWTDSPSKTYMLKMQPLWQALLTSAVTNFPELYLPERVAQLQEAIDTLPAYWQELEQMPMTFIHNDLNPRNTCFKQTKNGLEFCVYDWELATTHVPQYDVVELLAFVLDEDRYHLRPTYLAYYRQELEKLTGKFTDEAAFNKGFALAAQDFGLHRLGMYLMAHAVGPYPFLPRVVNSYFNTLEQFQEYRRSDLEKSAYLADS